MPMGMGENIGTAYIKILADGSGLNESIRRQFKDSEDWFDKEGAKQSAAWREGFIDDMSKKPNRNAIYDALRDPILRASFLERDFFNTKNWKDFRKGLETRFGEAGEQAGKNMEQGIRESGTFDAFIRDLENMTPALVRAQRQVDDARLAEMTKFHAEALEMDREFNERLFKDRLDMDREFEERAARLHEQTMKARLDADKEWELHIAEQARIAAAMEEKRRDDINWRIMLERAYAENVRRDDAERRQSIARLRELFTLLNRESSQLFRGDREAMPLGSQLDLIKTLRAEMGRLGVSNSVWNETLKDTENRLRRTHPTLDRFVILMDKSSDGIGRAFGKGSRNDFLNFIGSVAGGITRLTTTVLPRLTRGFLNYATSLGQAASEGRLFTKILGDFGKVAGGLGGAVAGIFGIVGPVVSIFSQLAGIVVALASSISFALVGAISSLAAVVLPAVAGIGALALAFYDLSKAEEKALKQDLKPLTDSLGDLADATRKGLFGNVEQQASQLSKVLDGLQPMFRQIGRAVSDVGDSWIESLSGPGFDRWRDTMSIFLPDAIRALGRITENVIGGFGGLFTGMIPFMRDVLAYLERITGAFRNWANSTQGQSEIIAFFERTKESLVDVGDFLGSVRDLLFELLDAGQGAGDSLFASMSDAIDGWVKTLQDNPDILDDWFDDAEAFGRVLGNLLQGLGKVFDALDNEFSRAAATFAFETLAQAINLVADALQAVARFLGIGENAFMGFAGQAAAAVFMVGRFKGALTGTNLASFVSNVRGAETRMSALAGAARVAAGAGGLMLLMDSMNDTERSASGLLKSIGGGALTGFAIGGPIGALIGGAAGAALDIFSNKAENAHEVMQGGQDTVMDYASTFDTLTGKVTQATEAMVLQELQQDGAISRAERFGISARTLVRATMGERDAILAVNRAMESGNSTALVFRNTTGGLVSVQADNAAQARRLTKFYEDQGFTLQETNRIMQDDSARKLLAGDIERIGNNWRSASRAERAAIIATQDLSAIFETIPRKIATKIDATGVVPTTKGIANVAEKYDLLPRQIKSLIEATGVDTTVKRVKNVQDELDETGAKKPKPKLDVDTSQFEHGMSESDRIVQQFVTGDYTAHITADNSQANSAISETERWLASLDGTTSTVYVRQKTLGGIQRAAGGIVHNPTMVTPWDMAGEAGSEAVVPLSRPLGEVDPAVRWLSAIAQGKGLPAAAGKQTVFADGAIRVYSPSADPYTVAMETVNQIAGRLY